MNGGSSANNTAAPTAAPATTTTAPPNARGAISRAGHGHDGPLMTSKRLTWPPTVSVWRTTTKKRPANRIEAERNEERTCTMRTWRVRSWRAFVGTGEFVASAFVTQRDGLISIYPSRAPSCELLPCERVWGPAACCGFGRTQA